MGTDSTAAWAFIATTVAADSGRSLGNICRETFPLPSLAKTLAASRYNLYHGPGIILLRGLEPHRYSRRENFILFAGVASHLSERRGRQSGGKYLGRTTVETMTDSWCSYQCGPYQGPHRERRPELICGTVL